MRRLLAIAGLSLAIVLLLPAGASAHPLGNFTVNRFAGIVVSSDAVRVDYVVDMAEVPTLQEMDRIDADGDGTASADELGAWADAGAAEVARGLQLTLGGDPVALAADSGSAELLAGQGGLQTLRLEVRASGPAVGEGALAFVDGNQDGRIGWHEVTLAGDGVTVSGADVPTTSVSDELRTYPQDMLASPLDVTSATARIRPGGPSLAEQAPGTVAAASPRPGTELLGFTGLLGNHGLPLIVLGLAVALALGAWHALLPGHGKTIMAAAMVGSGARARQVVTVAVSVALMHCASVLALGLGVLALQRTFRPEALYPWLGIASGLAAVSVGAYLLRARLRAWRHLRAHEIGPRGHDHSHEAVGATGRGLLAIAFAGGILPAPSALLVMLGAIQVHRVGYGLALVLAFSAGLAVSLAAVGAGASRARDALARRLSARAGVLVPIVSALAILVVGTAVAIRAAVAVV